MRKTRVGKLNNSSNDNLESYLEIIAKFCDKCGTKYTVNDLKVVQTSELSSIIHFTCSSCKSRHIATFLKPMGITSRTPINTDLEVEEISHFSNDNSVNADEVLQVYSSLKSDTILPLKK